MPPATRNEVLQGDLGGETVQEGERPAPSVRSDFGISQNISCYLRLAKVKTRVDMLF